MTDLYCEKTERAVLAIAFQSSDAELLWELELDDFFLPVHRLLFEELTMLVANEYPLADPVACARWFTSTAAKKRAKDKGIEDLSYTASEVFGEYVTQSHKVYYLDMLRRERLRRAMQLLGVMLKKKLEHDGQQPLEILVWLTEQVENLSVRCDSMNLT